MGTNPGASHDEGPAPGLASAADEIAKHGAGSKLKRGLLASVFTLASITVVLELGLRVTSYRDRHFAETVNKTNRRWVALSTARVFEEVADPVRRYAMRPGSEGAIDGWTFRISRHRTRGEDFPLEKEPGEKRLLCLGDSFAFGMWADEDETLVGHLARTANEREQELGSGVRWRAVNCGVPGYHAGQQQRAFEQDGLPLSPDAVVWYFNTNDIEQEGFFYDDDLGVLRRDFLPLPTGLRQMLWNSHLYGWIVMRHRRMIEAGPIPPHIDPSVPYAFVRDDNTRAARAAIHRVAALCRERDIPLVVVNQPHLTWQGDLQNPEWVLAPLVDWVDEVCAEVDVPTASLMGLFRGYSDGVDRLAEGGAPDFLLDVYCADVEIEAAVAWARERASESGTEWDELTLPQKLPILAGYPEPMPVAPDFHLTGEGYGHLARVAYGTLQAEGILP
jgi:hypothetical protein